MQNGPHWVIQADRVLQPHWVALVGNVRFHTQYFSTTSTGMCRGLWKSTGYLGSLALRCLYVQAARITTEPMPKRQMGYLRH